MAKIALGMVSTAAFAAVYTFREGVIRVDVDEFREGGSHVHVWVPAAAVPVALHFAPKEHMREAAAHLEPFLPTVRALAKELRKYPEATFVEVIDHDQHVKVGTHNGKIQIDVEEPGESVHVACPISTLEEIASGVTDNVPGA